MLSIFSDLAEWIMEVYMDDITVYGGNFEECLINLETELGEMPLHGQPGNSAGPHYLRKRD